MLKEQRVVEARNQFIAFLQLHSTYSPAQVRLAEIYWTMGQSGLAVNELEIVLKREPANVEAMLIMAEYVSKEDPCRSKKLYLTIQRDYADQVKMGAIAKKLQGIPVSDCKKGME